MPSSREGADMREGMVFQLGLMLKLSALGVGHPLVSTWALASGMVLGQRSREFGTPSWSSSEVGGVEVTVREMGEESVDAPPLSSAMAFRVCMPGVGGVKENVQGEEVLVEMRVFLS